MSQVAREEVRATLVITGRVQGVFYRASAQEEALRLALRGEVRNLPDGSVEVIAEGERAVIDEFVAWCRRGPPAARVEDVSVRLGPCRNEFRTFMVAR